MHSFTDPSSVSIGKKLWADMSLLILAIDTYTESAHNIPMRLRRSDSCLIKQLISSGIKWVCTLHHHLIFNFYLYDLRPYDLFQLPVNLPIHLPPNTPFREQTNWQKPMYRKYYFIKMSRKLLCRLLSLL